MSIFDKMKSMNWWDKVPEKVTVPLSISEGKLNQLAAKAISDESRIRSLTIKCSEGVLTLNGSVSVSVTTLNFSFGLALESFELSPQRKVIVLRRLDNFDLSGEGMMAALMAPVVKVLICGLFGVDIGALSLNGFEGLIVEKSLVTANLEKMGAMEVVTQGVQEKLVGSLNLGPLLEAAVRLAINAASDKIIANLTVEGLAINDGGIVGSVVVDMGWLRRD